MVQDYYIKELENIYERIDILIWQHFVEAYLRLLLVKKFTLAFIYKKKKKMEKKNKQTNNKQIKNYGIKFCGKKRVDK